MKAFISHYFKLLSGKNTKRQLIYLAFLIFVSSFLDMIGVGLVALFVSVLIKPEFRLLETSPDFLMPVFERYEVSQHTLIFVFALAIVFAFILKAIVGSYKQHKIAVFCAHEEHLLRLHFMSFYQSVSYLLILNRSTASISNLLGPQLRNCSIYLLAGLYFVANMMSIVTITALLCLTQFLPTISLFLLLSIFYSFHARFFRRRFKELSQTNYQSTQHLFKGIQEFFHGYKDMVVLQKEPFFIDHITQSSIRLADIKGKFALYQSVPLYIIELVFVVFIMGLASTLVVMGLHYDTIVPTISLFVVAGARLLPLVNRALSFSGQLKYNFSAVDAVCEELNSVSDASFRLREASRQDRENVFERVTFENVSFRYSDTDKNVLSHINLEIVAGQSIGIIGETGMGKTTLVNTMIGLFEPTEGVIKVNGDALSQKASFWLSQLAYIPQDIFLLDDTLLRNITFGDDSKVDRDRLDDAVRLACLDAVVATLPQGFDTLLGENGNMLSGGQRQRVALARAFYHQRNVIVMDEATSALDSKTEDDVLNSLKQLQGTRTFIVISHRLTAIQHCDVVYRLENGSITVDDTCLTDTVS